MPSASLMAAILAAGQAFGFASPLTIASASCSAARVAAGTAVGAAQRFAYFGYPRVHLNGQLFIRNFKQYAEYQSYNAKHAQCKYYRDPIHFVPSLRAKAREAP